MNYAAIEHLATVLDEKVPDALWDFRFVRCFPDGDGCSLGDTVLDALDRLEPDCGTAGCAVQHARAAFPNADIRTAEALADVLGMDVRDTLAICGMNANVGLHAIYGEHFHDAVTRHDVAAALRRYAREGAWWR